MIEAETQAWLSALPEKVPTSLIIQLARLPEAELAGLKTAKARVAFLADHLSRILDPIARKHGIAGAEIQMLGALGQAIIQGSPETLRGLVAASGDLARSRELTARPNKLISGGGGNVRD